MFIKKDKKSIHNIIIISFLLYSSISISLVQAVEKTEIASSDTSTLNPKTVQNKIKSEKFKIQIGAYSILDTSTKASINSSIGNIGTGIDMERDLGIDDNNIIPRIDMYYRFNDKHRIDFSWFNVDRSGTRTIGLEFKVGDQTFAANSVIETSIETSFYKLAYVYSFYRNEKVELAISAGLNIVEYDIELNDKTNNKFSAADVTAPLPVFGLRMDYAITPRWLVHYRLETFFIDIKDKFSGSLIDSAIGTEYRLFKNVGLGLELSSFIFDADVTSTKYTGGLTDSYNGINLYVAAYF